MKAWFLYHAHIDKSCLSPAPISSAKMVIMPSLCGSSGSVVGGALSAFCVCQKGVQEQKWRYGSVQVWAVLYKESRMLKRLVAWKMRGGGGGERRKRGGNCGRGLLGEATKDSRAVRRAERAG